MSTKQYQKQWFPPQEQCEISDFLVGCTEETNLAFSLNVVPGTGCQMLFISRPWFGKQSYRVIGKMLER